MKIVADSSANLMELQSADFASAPMKIITSDKEFVDSHELDVDAMINFFSKYKGKSQTSCPNTSDWLEAFGDADDIFCVRSQADCLAATMPPALPKKCTKMNIRTDGCM